VATLYYFYDPMCSWCWGYKPVAAQLFKSLPEDVTLVKVLGGLAPDSDVPMPAAQQQAVAGYWREISALLGTRFNHDFWTQCKPRRSTYPACRAVIAADLQSTVGAVSAADAMNDAIQRAYYLRAMNPSNIDTLQALAAELGLDEQRFSDDLASAAVEAELQRQLAFARMAPDRGYPSLALSREQEGEQGEPGRVLVSVQQDYQSAQATLDHLQELRAAPVS